VTSDGIFGKGTESVLKAWQRSNGLFPDGILGTNTYEKLFE
jgi:peptidoglycan hydrolase-like protein with peptidoglycan-binding domain